MAVKASDRVKYYENPNGPVIGTVNRNVIEKDGLYFKDLDGSGEWKIYDDRRIPAKECAEAYVKELTLEEKIAQLFISDWRMGKYPAGGPVETISEEKVLDESGLLDDGEFRGKTIFGEQHLPGTTTLLKEWFSRHMILHANPTPEDMADWMNQLHAVAEECEHLIPAFRIAVKNHTSSIMPYYSKPAVDKSAVQKDCNGKELEFQPFGFAYNRPFLQEMLRERIGFAVNHAGVDLISGLFDNEAGLEAYMRGKNGYYEEHPVPEGFTKEQLILTDEALDRAVARTLEEMFSGVTLTEKEEDADYATLMISPSSGEYFSATKGYLELDICDGKEVCDVSEDGKPLSRTHKETTLAGAERIQKIAETVHANGGKIISNINVTLAWLAVNAEGICTSPNDVPEIIMS